MENLLKLLWLSNLLFEEDPLMAKKIIYFLCTGNSCRSQMAEGFGKYYLGDDYLVLSAGMKRHG